MRGAEAASPHDEDGVSAHSEAETHTNGPGLPTEGSKAAGAPSLLQLLHTFQGTCCPFGQHFFLKSYPCSQVLSWLYTALGTAC